MRFWKRKNKEAGEPQQQGNPNRDKFIRRVQLAGAIILILPATAGAILSWQGLYTGASTAFPDRMAAIFSLLVDALAVGSSAMWVASVRQGTPNNGWRVLAHASIATTVAMNAYSAYPDWGEMPWHVVPALVWSAITELAAKDLAQAHKRETGPVGDGIRWTLWLASPLESVRTKLRQARTGETSAIQARADVVHIAAAKVSVRRTARGLRNWGVRRIISRQLRRGALAPGVVPELVAKHQDDSASLLASVQAAVLEHASETPVGSHRKKSDTPVVEPELTVDGQPVELTEPVSFDHGQSDRELDGQPVNGQAGQPPVNDETDRPELTTVNLTGQPVTDHSGQVPVSSDTDRSERGQAAGQNVVRTVAVDRSVAELTSNRSADQREALTGQVEKADRPVDRKSGRSQMERVIAAARERHNGERITTSWLREISGVSGKQTICDARKALLQELETNGGHLLKPRETEVVSHN